MEKKIACGAKFLITQVGWDWKKSVELMRYLKENHIYIPVLGNVLLVKHHNACAAAYARYKTAGLLCQR
jgi:methylenetetrahydrofolate reductase (NADPH)